MIFPTFRRRFFNKKNIIFFFCALILGIVFTGLLTWPFILHISTFYKDGGDYALNGWIMWHNYMALLNGDIFNQTAYFRSNQYFGMSYSFAYSEHMFIPSLIFSLLYGITHNLVFSQNILLFLSFVLTFISTLYVASYFTKKVSVAIIGAFIFTFNPITFAHFPYHFQLMHKYFLPPVFLCAYLFFKQPTLKKAFFFFLFFTLNALSVIYYQMFSIIFIVLMFIPFFLHNLWKKNNIYFFSLFKYGLIGIPFLLVLLYFDLPYIYFSQKEGIIRSLIEIQGFSGTLLDWFSPHINSWLYKTVAFEALKLRQIPDIPFNFAEHTLFLGIVPVILGLVGIYNIIKSRVWNYYDNYLLIGATLFLFTAAILSFGPYFVFNTNISSIKLPFYYLYKITPLFDGTRSVSRFQLFFYLPFAFLVASGFFYIQHFIQKSYLKIIVCVTVLLLLSAENYLKMSFTETSTLISQVKTYKKNNPDIINLLDNKKTLHIPFYIPGDAATERVQTEYLLWAIETHETTLNGYSGYFPKRSLNFLYSLLTDRFSSDSKDMLKALGMDYVIVHKDHLNELNNSMQVLLADSKKNLKSLLIYEDSQLAIYDMHSYKQPVKTCNPRDALDITFFPEQYNWYTEPLAYQAVIKNKYDCYSTQVYDDQYLQVTIDVDGKKMKSILQLPLVIKPNQTIVLVGSTKPAKNRIGYLARGNHRITIAAPDFSSKSEANLFVDDNTSPQKKNSSSPDFLQYKIENYTIDKHSDRHYTVSLTTKNIGNTIWLTSRNAKDPQGKVLVAFEYLDSNGKPIKESAETPVINRRCPLPISVDVDRTAKLICPLDVPVGTVSVEVQMVDEMIQFFPQQPHIIPLEP